MRRPPASLAGLVLLAALITFVAGITVAGAGSVTEALRVFALTAVLLVVGWLLAPRR